MTAREVLLAWAKSPGFAAIHNGQATDEQIVDDLFAWLVARRFLVISMRDVEDSLREIALAKDTAPAAQGIAR